MSSPSRHKERMFINAAQLLLFFSMMLSFGVVASASDDSDSKAMAAFKRGTKLYKREQYGQAAMAFREAYDLRPSWRILFNIGQCNAAAKEYGLALEAFEAYLSQGGDEVPLEQRDQVIAEIRTLRELVGYLAVEAPPGAAIKVDGHSRGVTPLPGPLLVAAGVNHEVKIEKDGEILFLKTVRINSANTLRVNATRESDSATADASPADMPADDVVDHADSGQKSGQYSRPLRIAGWTSAILGVGLIGGGVATGVKALSLSNELEERDCRGDECDEDIKKMDNLEVTTNVLLGVGGGVALAGVTMLIVSYVSERRRQKELSVTPALLPDHIGLVVQF